MQPFELAYVDTTSSRYEAIATERQIKNWSRKKKEALIESNFDKLSLLGKKKF
jgi:putative endonuclease